MFWVLFSTDVVQSLLEPWSTQLLLLLDVVSPAGFTAHCIKSHFLLFVLDSTLSSLKVCAALLPVDSFDPYLL